MAWQLSILVSTFRPQYSRLPHWTEVKANPQGKTPARIPPMSDTKNGWLAKDGWVKRVQNVNKIEIHYIENSRTGEKTDFKFKD